MDKKRKATSSLENLLLSTSELQRCRSLAKEASSNSFNNSMSKKPTINTEVSQAPDVAIANFLEEIRSKIQNERYGGGNIEIEARLGTITSNLTKKRISPSQHGIDASIVLSDASMSEMDLSFVPGVSESSFQSFSHKMKKQVEQQLFSTQLERQISYICPDSKRIIQPFDPETGVKLPAYSEKKIRIGTLEIFLPGCAYDFRLCVACEYPPQPVETGFEATTNFEHVRDKDRVCYIAKEMRMDFTVVKESEGQVLHEVEIELLSQVTNEYLGLPEDCHGRKRIYEITAKLWNMMRSFMPKAGQAFKMGKVADPIRNCYMRFFGKKTESFPGTMPVGFARRHFDFIKKHKYWVSEKTDGVRYFLVVCRGNVVLIDRTNSAFTTAGLALLTSVFPDGTVLDGEFVFHQRDQKYIFMAFDILSTGISESDCHVLKPFSERLHILNRFLSIEGPYSVVLESSIHYNSVITIMRKKWMAYKEIMEVFKLIQKVKFPNGSVGRIYNDGRREHLTDGIIFCPDSKYICGTHQNYMKWKWADLISIDFRVRGKDGKLHIGCEGPEDSKINLDSQVVVAPKDREKLLVLLSKLPGSTGVFEFDFDAEDGFWHYKCHRRDKDRANYIATVVGSLMNLAEAVSEEELQYRILGSGENWTNSSKKWRRDMLRHLS